MAGLLLVAALAGAATIGLRHLSAFEWVEHATLEARFSLRGEARPSPDVVVVALDAKSLRGFDEAPPVPRATDAKLIDRLRRAGAATIVFDLTLEQRSADRAGDLALTRALARTGAAVVSVQAIGDDAQTRLLAGVREFDHARVLAGHTYLPTDADGAIRRFPVSYRGVPSLAAVAAVLHGRGAVPKDPPAGALIDFAGDAGTIPALSFGDVLAGRFIPRAVRDRIVVIGPTAPELQDLHATSMGGAPMSGPEIHSSAIATALADYPLRTVSSTTTGVVVLLLALAVSVLLATRTIRARVGAGTVIAAGALVLSAWTVAAQLAFNSGTVVDYTAGGVGVLTTCAGAGTLRLRRRGAKFAADLPQERDPAGATDEAGARASGEIVAGYRIEGVIGEGEMGVVYRARHPPQARGRPQAHPTAACPAAIVPRSVSARDARSRARRHPNIVPVYDAGEDDGVPYIAMMLVDGIDLAETVAHFGPLDHEMLATVLRQIASALDAAHSRGLVHRDVKPANILTADHGHAYLTDFGIAVQASAAERLTRTGDWVGSTDYLAPEMAAGNPATPRSDVYALTGVLYYCLTGSVPFDLPSEAAKLRAHAEATRRRCAPQHRTFAQRSTALSPGVWRRCRPIGTRPAPSWRKMQDERSGGAPDHRRRRSDLGATHATRRMNPPADRRPRRRHRSGPHATSPAARCGSTLAAAG